MSKESKNLPSTNSVLDLEKLTKSDVPALLKVVTEKITELRGGIPKEGKTTGDLPGFGKIKDIKTVQDLVKAHSMVVNKARVYRESAEEMDINLKKYPFKIGGSVESSWVNDIKATINVVRNKVELEKLTKTKAILESHLSEEAKLAKDLKAIANSFLVE